MSQHYSWAVSSSPNGLITTEDARLATTALLQPGPTSTSSETGIRAAAGDPGTVQVAADTSFVTVRPFQMFMRSNRGAGSYIQTYDDPTPIDVLKHAPAATAARVDLIVAQQSDMSYPGDTGNGFAVRHIPGVPGTPGDPPVSGSTDFVVLARINVKGGATALTPDMIQNNSQLKRVVALGGIAPVRTADDRPAIAQTYSGQTVYRQDRGWLEISDGSRWRVPSIPVCASFADLTATIKDPALGQLVLSADDGMLYRWTGGSWLGVIDCGTGASPTERHEARYETHGQGQHITGSETRIRFPDKVYESNDVVHDETFGTFTLTRGGLWRITTSQRLFAAGPGGDGGVGDDFDKNLYESYIAIVDASNYGIRYANANHDQRRKVPAALNCVAENVFPAGTQLSVIMWTSVPCDQDTSWPNINNITLTWLRP
ncbi:MULTISPECIES: hypothetical protein [unclassified Nocardia]|uniref:hypothetical protein n=1 Tax=unclassified Nocardia TaxID=2637762 RepID=UPI001CE4B209|nr:MULTISPECIES: hypothetical protein [unclassified Nocardia]